MNTVTKSNGTFLKRDVPHEGPIRALSRYEGLRGGDKFGPKFDGEGIRILCGDR